MKPICLFLLITLAACGSNDEHSNSVDDRDSNIIITEPAPEIKPVKPSPAIYANDRFKEVTVQKTGDHEFLVTGKGQIFEANFSWVVEDGHEELKQGHQMTDAGAPEWGKFSFTLDVQKKRENSTLILILFEASAEDGSRQHELPIPLPND